MEMEKEKDKKKMRWKKPLVLSSMVMVLLLVAGYFGLVYYYGNHFLPGSVLNNRDISGMSADAVLASATGYSLEVTARNKDGEEEKIRFTGPEIGVAVSDSNKILEMLAGQNPYMWFVTKNNNIQDDGLYSLDENLLKSMAENIPGFRGGEAPKDARLSEYIEKTGYEIIPEEKGNRLIEDKTIEVVKEAVAKGERYVNLIEKNCYEEPGILSDDADLQKKLKELNTCVSTNLIYQFGEKTETLTGDEIHEWLTVSGNDIAVEEEPVKEYVKELRKNHDTVFKNREFQTSYDKTVTIKGGDYGWWMDVDAETEELKNLILQGAVGERTPVYRQTACSYGEKDYGDTYVEINLTAQHLFFYKDGELILETDIVTGNPSRGNATPEGVYGLTYKQKDATLNGVGYSTKVSFWMPFNGNIGMHDATWRGKFGGRVYQTNGSHGCVNMPFSAAKKIYDYMEKGLPVLCYKLSGTESAPEPVPEPVPVIPLPDPGIPVPIAPGQVPVEPAPALPEQLPAGT